MSDENQEREPGLFGEPAAPVEPREARPRDDERTADGEYPGLEAGPPPVPAEPPVTFTRALSELGEQSAASEAPPPWFEVLRELSPPGFFPWLAIIFSFGVAALWLGQTDTALLVGVTGLFVTAHGADTHRDWHLVNALVSWIPCVVGFVFLGLLAGVLAQSAFPPATRLAVTAIAGLGAALCLLTLFPPVVDSLCRLVYREGDPGHVRRLAARLLLFSLALSPSAWFALRGLLSSVLDQPNLLVSASGLSGSLVGYVLLAVGSVGWLIRRPLRGTLERLGLLSLRPADAWVIPLGVIALWAFNSGSEIVQKSLFPSLWLGDQRFTAEIARNMGAGQMLLLGLSAGVGEEITMRGALQPRIGIVLTSLVFASLHVQYSWYGMASIFVFGMILGTIRARGSTTSAIVVHALYDTLALATARG